MGNWKSPGLNHPSDLPALKEGASSLPTYDSMHLPLRVWVHKRSCAFACVYNTSTRPQVTDSIRRSKQICGEKVAASILVGEDAVLPE